MDLETSARLIAQSEELRKEAESLRRIERAYEQHKECAMILGNMRDCLLNEGFTKEEAYDLVKTFIAMGGNK